MPVIVVVHCAQAYAAARRFRDIARRVRQGISPALTPPAALSPLRLSRLVPVAALRARLDGF